MKNKNLIGCNIGDINKIWEGGCMQYIEYLEFLFICSYYEKKIRYILHTSLFVANINRNYFYIQVFECSLS